MNALPWRGVSSQISTTTLGEAALVIVGETTIEAYVEKAALKAQRKVAKELQIYKKDVDQAVQEAAKSLS